jgi:hypothetical protein
MTIKDIAAAFDMKVKEFATFTGYSRQALYNDGIPYCRRSIAMLEKLEMRNEEMYKADKARAFLAHDRRSKAIAELKEQFMERGTT